MCNRFACILKIRFHPTLNSSLQCNPDSYAIYLAEKSTSNRNNREVEKDTTIVNNKLTTVKWSQLNDAIIEFIVEDQQPFCRAESRAFRNLVAGIPYIISKYLWYM